MKIAKKEEKFREGKLRQRKLRYRCSIMAMTLAAASALLLFPADQAKADYDLLPAFPGAEGFGYAAAGGRGGEVYIVDSRELTGPGTFHDALTTVGDTPRTIVFGISGDLEIPQTIVKNSSKITIAGQTAPGGGVTVKGNTIRFLNCSDVVIRYMRFRMGSDKSQDDAMYLEDCQNMMIDHCSYSWAGDEILSIKSKKYEDQKSKNITVQWSVMSEGLLTHSMGGLVEMNTISMHHNLYAHNNDRNPKTKGVMDFVNNIVYNWGDYPYVAGGESGTKGYGNVIGNYFIAGINSKNPEYAVVRGNENYNVYLHDNRIDSNKNGKLDGTDTGAGMVEESRPANIVPDRFEYPPVHTQAPEEAYEDILDYAGASVARDQVDVRVTDGVRNQTGAIIGHENDVGGYPKLKEGQALADTDQDGMPDEWETKSGLDPNNPEDRNEDPNGNGYTNLEEYLNQLAEPGFPSEYPMTPVDWSGEVFDPPADPEPEKEKEILPVMNGEILRNVVVNDTSGNGEANARNWSVQQNLQPGNYVAGDRVTGSSVYKFESIPEELKGLEWIRTAVESRSASNDDLLSFYLAADAEIYVAHDSRITKKPDWIKNVYQDTGLVIEDSQPVSWNVYKAKYSAGSKVTMGQNGNGKNMNYFVLVKPTGQQTPNPVSGPKDLKAETAESFISLKWGDAETATSYLIYRSSLFDPNWRVIGSTSETEFPDKDAVDGIQYSYQVSAVNAGGESKQSDLVKALMVDSSQPVPKAPQGLEVSDHGSYFAKISWIPAEQTLGTVIYRSTSVNGEYRAVGAVYSGEFRDNSAEPSTTYYYRIASVSEGGESELSGPVEVMTNPELEKVNPPAGLSAKDVTSTAFSIHWEMVNGAEGYRLYRCEKGGEYEQIIETTDTQYEDKGFAASNDSYNYAVTAFNELGESTYSVVLNVDLPRPNHPDQLVAGLIGDTFVGLIWDSGGGQTEYVIYRGSDSEEPKTVGTAKVKTFYDRTAKPGSTYTYFVKASNAAGESEPSTAITVTTLPARWDENQTYGSKDLVSYQGNVFEAQWWSKGDIPGDDPAGPWAELGKEVSTGNGDYRTWTDSQIYMSGDKVVCQGHIWEAQWWNRNEEPGTTEGTWKDLGESER